MFRLQKTLAKFYKWPNNITERVSGSVCGLDPRYCVDPPSTGAHTWPDDITKWPICKKKADVISRGTAPHMTCEVIGPDQMISIWKIFWQLHLIWWCIGGWSSLLHWYSRRMSNYYTWILWFCPRILPWDGIAVLTSFMYGQDLWHAAIFWSGSARSVLPGVDSHVFACRVSTL